MSKRLTVSQVAEMLGWDYYRVSRALHKLNAETHGLLLRNVGGQGKGARWTVTLVDLKRVAPEWFDDDTCDDERIVSLEERVETLERQQNMTASAVGDMSRRLDRDRVA